MAERRALEFGGLLRQLRAEAQLTQEELAEAARLSPRSVSDLERGINRTARKDTAVLLAGALGLVEPVRSLFVAAALGHVPPPQVLAAIQEQAQAASTVAATSTLPRDAISFTGREHELTLLLDPLPGAAGGGAVSVYAIDGMAGIGKTTLAVHAAHRLAASFPDGQFFLPLHAHTPGQRPVQPADALASLLLTAGVAAAQIPPSAEARAARWRDHVAGKKILLLLDDAAGHAQIRPLLPGTAGSLVLITSRRRLGALPDATVISLSTLSPEEAATLLVRLAARPGMQAADEAGGELARLCGYLPLAIAMLASQLRHHPAWTTTSLAASLAAAQDRLVVMHAEDLSVAAAFDLSYADLTSAQQRLFRRLGLVPGPSVDAYAAAALDGIGPDAAGRHLDALYDQHLLTEPAPGRHVLHDLLRAHAQALAAADDPAESDAATSRLLDYYLHTAQAADRHIPSLPAPHRRGPENPPAYAPDLATVEQAATWLETERLNLHAAAAQAAMCGHTLHAVQIPAAMRGFLIAHGHWDQMAALHRIAQAAARQAGDRTGQPGARTTQDILRSPAADSPAAAASLSRAQALHETYALNLLLLLRPLAANRPVAAASYQQVLTLAQLGDQLGQATALHHLGLVLRQADDYPAAAASLQQAADLFRRLGHHLGQAWALDDLGIVHQKATDYTAAADTHQSALGLFRDAGNQPGQAVTLNNLGQLALHTADLDQASRYYGQALAIARGINAPTDQARALEGLGQVHLKNGDPGEAASHLRQALTIYHRAGTPADVHRIEETLRRHEL
jgi:tetratricopeptide (TPR) repeat protein/transcriptional regulator with XRE-family HTH domain/DNA-binding transcriptional ArsR family regulator